MQEQIAQRILELTENPNLKFKCNLSYGFIFTDASHGDTEFHSIYLLHEDSRDQFALNPENHMKIKKMHALYTA